MSWFKCSIILLFISSNAFAGRFTSNECLRSSFSASVEHNGKFFGLIKNKLNIEKKECLIEIKFKNILETKWVIDLCREPIHMKVHSKGSESVFKRNGKCDGGNKSDFCVYWGELYETLQDYGLIFAKGERELLSTDHGRTYCSYLLLKKHLDDGVLFSKYRESVELFEQTDLGRIEKSTSVVKEIESPREESKIKVSTPEQEDSETKDRF